MVTANSTYNILNELDKSYHKQTVSYMVATANLRYKPLEWFNVNLILSANASKTDIEGYWGEETFYAADLRGCELNEAPEANSRMPYGGELSKNNTHSRSYTARLQANLNKYFGHDEEHNINVSLRFEGSSNQYDGYSG